MRLALRLSALTLLCLVPMLAAQIYMQIELRSERRQEIGRQIERQAELARTDLAGVLEGARQFATAAAEFPSTPALARNCGDRLASLRRSSPAYRLLAAYGPGSRPICASDPALIGAPAPDWLGALSSDGFSVGRYSAGPGTLGAFLPVAVPLQPGSSGILVAGIDLGWIAAQLHDAEPGAPGRSALTVLDGSGTVLARFPGPDWIGKRAPPDIEQIASLKPAVAREFTAANGAQHVAAAATVAGTGLVAVASLDPSDLMAGINRATLPESVLAGLSTMLAVLLTYWAGLRFIYTPAQRLLDAATRWRAGDYAARVNLTERRSEFGTLAAAFDEMAGALAARERERRQQARLLEAQVAERTRKLSEMNNRLQVETAERERTAAALQQAQKLQAVGQLAAGIAHDFNNMLATLMGSLELMERRLEDPARLRGLVERSITAVQRGAQLTARLLAFSRRQRLAAQPTDLNRLVSDLLTLVNATVGRKVRIVAQLAPDLWAATADAGQVEAALLNIFLNARDAMPDGGTVTITTRNETVIAPSARAGLAPGEYVRISIADTGVGMEPEVQRRAFDPFFSTKGPGSTGLGLSQVYGVAHQTGGDVWIDSVGMQGTTVSLLLPRARAVTDGEPAFSTAHEEEPVVLRSRVLLVDDDPAVRQVTADMLRDLGCAVVEAQSGSEALDLFENPASGIEIAVLDYAMPGMNGLELARALRRRGLLFPIVLATGYAELGAPAETGDVRLTAILRKPFTLQGLRDTLVRVLGQRRGSTADIIPLRSTRRGWDASPRQTGN